MSCGAAWKRWSQARWPPPPSSRTNLISGRTVARKSFNLETLHLLFTDIAILELDREDARTAGEIRAALARQGTPIGPYDVLIAGQAKARGLTLVTSNLSEFQRVDGLKLEDWGQP